MDGGATGLQTGWRIAAARLRGESHARRSERGQDAFRVLTAGRDGALLIVAAADGAGSAPRGGAGAALAVRAATEVPRAALGEGGAVAALAEDAPRRWALAARDRVVSSAAIAGLEARDCATTLLLAVSDGEATAVAHVGDGAVVARGADGAWRALSWPEGGVHAGETRFLTEEEPAIRVTLDHAPVSALALLTDGIERLVLDFAAGAPHAPFFDRIAGPVDRLAAAGRDLSLGRALRAYLAGEGVAARTDDDRTLVLASLGPREAETA